MQEIIKNQDDGQQIVKTNRDNWLSDIRKLKKDIQSSLSDQEKELVIGDIDRLKHSFINNIAMSCKQHECIFVDSCPLLKINKAPEIGESCPIEMELLLYHIEQLATQFNIDPERDYSERLQIIELAECIVYEERATKLLAIDGNADLLLRTERFTQQGDSFTLTEIHPALIVKEKMRERRKRILESMLGTRKEKSKIIKSIIKNNDYSSNMANLKKQFEIDK